MHNSHNMKNALLCVILLSKQPTSRGGHLGKKLYILYRKWTMRGRKVLSPTVVIGTFYVMNILVYGFYCIAHWLIRLQIGFL